MRNSNFQLLIVLYKLVVMKRLKPGMIMIVLFLLMIFPYSHSNCQLTAPPGNVFSRNNLVAWCIVPFDSKKRGPEARAQMLVSLGIKKFAYDWREEHVPTFDQEMDAMKRHHIVLQGFWMPYGPDPINNKHYNEILSLLKRHHLKTQLWWSYGNSDISLMNFTQEEKVVKVGNMIKSMATDAAKIGCTIGLYGHSGWFGQPENQLEIIEYVKMTNVGMVYNLNHAEDQVDRFPIFFPKILPFLIAINIAGLKNGKPGKVVPVGQGDSETEMIRIIGESTYAGTIGIINEDTDPDAAVGLALNLTGLKKILTSLGYQSALKTYQ